MKEKTLRHATLTTGHIRPSPRSEVPESVIDFMSGWLNSVLEEGSGDIPNCPGFRASARKVRGGLLLSVESKGQPLVTMGVSNAEDGKFLWDFLTAQPTGKTTLKMPGTPWCAAMLHPSAILYPEALGWIGDFERCVAWTWIENGEEQS